jgi:hypothetical protein
MAACLLIEASAALCSTIVCAQLLPVCCAGLLLGAVPLLHALAAQAEGVTRCCLAGCRCRMRVAKRCVVGQPL